VNSVADVTFRQKDLYNVFVLLIIQTNAEYQSLLSLMVKDLEKRGDVMDPSVAARCSRQNEECSEGGSMSPPSVADMNTAEDVEEANLLAGLASTFIALGKVPGSHSSMEQMFILPWFDPQRVCMDKKSAILIMLKLVEFSDRKEVVSWCSACHSAEELIAVQSVQSKSEINTREFFGEYAEQHCGHIQGELIGIVSECLVLFFLFFLYYKLVQLFSALGLFNNGRRRHQVAMNCH